MAWPASGSGAGYYGIFLHAPSSMDFIVDIANSNIHHNNGGGIHYESDWLMGRSITVDGLIVDNNSGDTTLHHLNIITNPSFTSNRGSIELATNSYVNQAPIANLLFE